MIPYKGGDIVKLFKGQVAKIESISYKNNVWFIACRIGCRLIILTDIKEIRYKIKDAHEVD